MLHAGPRRAAKTTAPHSTTSGARMLLQYRDLGVTTAWEEDPPGSAGVPPAQYLAQPRPSPRPGSTGKGAMPLLSAGPIPVPAGRAAVLPHRARNPSGNPRDSMRFILPCRESVATLLNGFRGTPRWHHTLRSPPAKLERQPKGQHAGGTPALPGVSSRWCGGGYPGGDFSESRPAPFGKLPFGSVRRLPLRARITPVCPRAWPRHPTPGRIIRE